MVPKKEEKHWKNRKPNNSADTEVKQTDQNYRKKVIRSMDINDQVSEYINRAKSRIRSVTMRGGEGKSKAETYQRHDSHFTNYIHRLKMRLRSSLSTVGTGKDGTA